MFPSRAVFILIFVPLLALPPRGAYSQENNEEGVLFFGGDTVYTPSRRAQAMEESPAPVTVITREDIRRSGALTLPEVLALAPGVDMVRRSEAGVEISIRGFNTYSSNKVLVMLDSRPLLNHADAATNWNLLPVPIEAIERIEIVRGPGSVLYGENAFFGTINIITRKAEQGSALAGGGAGSGDSRWFGAGVSSRGFGLEAEYLDLNRFSDDDSNVPNQLLDEIGSKPVVARVNIDRVFFRWEPGLEGAPTLTGGVSYVDTDYGSFRTVDRAAFAAFDQKFRDQGVDYQLDMRVLAQDQRVNEEPFPDDPYQKFLRADFELRGVSTPAVPDVVVFGAAFSHRTFEDDVFLDPDKQEIRQAVVSAFVENELAVAERRIFLTTGVRGDGYQGLRGVVSPRAGLVFILTPEQSIKLGWGNAYRSPGIYELYGQNLQTPPWVFTGNPGLRPESVSSWNLDYFYQDGERLAFSVTLFHHQIEDLIVFKLASTSIAERRYRYENEDRAESYGGEVEARLALTRRLELWCNYSYNEANYLREGELIEAPFSPRHKANAGIYYADRNWRVSLRGRYVGKQDGVNFDAPFQERIELKDYGMISARIETMLPYDFSVSVTGSDLFGQGHYEAPTYAPVTPCYFVQLKWEPGR